MTRINHSLVLQHRSTLMSAALVLLFVFCIQESVLCQVGSEGEVVFFPTDARQSDNGESWVIPVHGWIFERNNDGFFRNVLLQQLEESLGILTPAKSALLKERLQPFLVDNERGKVVEIELAGSVFSMPPSRLDGHFHGVATLSNEAVRSVDEDGTLTMRARLPIGDMREFKGTVRLLSPRGISVISDIDDTIRDASVLKLDEALRNTLLHSFRPVKGMTAVYKSWSERGVEFHYVSASPWQLYEPLKEFIREFDFPAATIQLQPMRLTDLTAFTTVVSPYESKLAATVRLIARFPQRKFVLIGDSGQQDAQVYAEVARRFPSQILHVWIRDLGNSKSTGRMASIFREVQPGWTLFREAEELKLLPNVP